MSSCVTRKVVIHPSVIPGLVDISRKLFMLGKAAEATKVPSALPMIHFMYFIVDSLNDNGCGAYSDIL